MTPEGKIKAYLKKALKDAFGDYWKHGPPGQRQCYWEFWPVQNGMGKATLDCILCINGHFVAFETKKPGGKPTPRQTTTINDLRIAGAMVFVVDSENSIDASIADIKWVHNI